MRATIVQIGRASLDTLIPLLLLGEGAENPNFTPTVQDTLRELLTDASTQNVLTTLLSGKRASEIEPLHLATRGAAEFAKRTHKAPAGCKAAAHCAKNRVPPKYILSKQVALSDGRQKSGARNFTSGP